MSDEKDRATITQPDPEETLVDFFMLLLAIDQRLNPEVYVWKESVNT